MSLLDLIAPGVGPLISLVSTAASTAIDRLVPDKNAAERLKNEIQKELAEADIKGALAQLEINKVEAASPSLFIGGGRPAVMWVCVVALALFFWPKFLLGAIFWIRDAWVQGHLVPYPDMGISDVLGLLTPLLGIGVMRSVDKAMGTDTKAIK